MRQTILTIVLVGAVLATGLIWFYYFRRPSAEAPAVPEAVVDPARLREYRELRGLSLDISVFSDPFFQVLEAPEPLPAVPGISAGRADPFAPF